MRPSEASKIIEGMPTQEWVIFNNNQTGYYRVNYDQQNWDLIGDQLLRDHSVIGPINKAQIINDAMTLARAGEHQRGLRNQVSKYLFILVFTIAIR